MAKKKYDGSLNKNMDFTAAGPNGEPASGKAVQNYIKSIDSKKVGAGYTTPDGATHLFFADAEDREKYLADPTKEELVIDRVSLDVLYTMSINLLTPSFVPVFLGSTGNYIEFTFETQNKNGAPVGESVIVTYVITRGGTTQTVTETYHAGATARFNVDAYLSEGLNNISIKVAGQQTLVYSSVGVSYQVINLSLTDEMNIAAVHRIVDGEDISLEVPYTVNGTGQKTMEWYLDGEKLDFIQSEDEINETQSTRTKYIPIDLLSEGVHSIQFRVGVKVSGETFYSNALYREFFVVRDNSLTGVQCAIALDFPVSEGILESPCLFAEQFAPVEMRVAAFNPAGGFQNAVTVLVDGTQAASVECTEGEEETILLSFTTSGEKTVSLTSGESTRTFAADIEPTSMNIREITQDRVLLFSADGRNNNSVNKDSWSYGAYHATFSGFKWNETSGWVDGKLLIPSDASLAFNYAPLSEDPMSSGKTIELEFASVNVENDDAVLLDLMENNVGIKITATNILIRSKAGVELSRQYKSGDNIRLSIVINRRSGVTNKGLVFFYFNGINSGAGNFATTDSFVSSKLMSLGGDGAGILLKQLIIYDTALSMDSVMNNQILYRDTVAEMIAFYDRNNLYETGTTKFNIDKIASYLPVLLITGNIPAIENTTDKKLQITADVEYRNLQNPHLAFSVRKAIITGQGTSSMFFPKKNLRLYTNKSDQTMLYDYQGNLIPNGKYAFKDGAQPVDCWCFKTDYAESSGAHNTGIARLWNDIIKGVKVNEEYVLRTEAQKTAMDNGYAYDVRTTVDGYPVVVFYRLTEEDDWIFLGKYNFNNDKSTESVFGFTDIPGFDNSKVQCFEFLDSANALALFTTVENFDTKWSGAWESRYPDTKTPNLAPLKRLATWINSTKNDLAKWKAEKADYFDLNKLASYYDYLMRFGAVDQTVKNAMITTEDGLHWFFILYDNDTINGVRNDGVLKYAPTIDRQSWDSDYNSYAYAGHDSVLWNNFEADDECMALVKDIDNALYSAGLTYENVINMFNNLQSGKWAETIYNRDAQYKYIDPAVNQDLKTVLPLLQGSRADHRKWWLSNRFAFYDAKFTNGAYTGKRITFRANAYQGDKIKIVAGKTFSFGYGLNAYPLESGVEVNAKESHTFSLAQNINVGSPVGIYAPYYIEELDLSDFINRIGQSLDISAVNDAELGSMLKRLILGVDVDGDERRNTALADISGLANAVNLEKLDIAGYQNITSLDLSALKSLKTLKARKSGLTSVLFAAGAPVSSLELPSSMQSLTLRSLPELHTSGISLDDNGKNITTIDVRNCLNISNSPNLLLDWIDHKVSDDKDCAVYMDGVEWASITPENLIKIGQIKVNGGTLTLRGVANLTTTSQEIAQQLVDIFGPTAFQEDSEFYITGPDAVYITGPTEINEGESGRFIATVFSQEVGTVSYAIVSGSRQGVSLNSSTGVLTSVENGLATSVLTIRATHQSTSGQLAYAEIQVSIVQLVYPTMSQVQITGDGNLRVGKKSQFAVTYPGGITGHMTASWAITGDLAQYASIVTSDLNTCVVELNSAPQADSVSGSLVLSLTKTNSGSVIGSKTQALLYQNTTEVTITESTNQGTSEDVADLSASVKYGNTTVSVKNGKSVSIPRGTSFTVTFPAVTGYATPAPFTLTASGGTMTLNGAYNTEVVIVTASTETDGVTAEGQIITINGTNYTVGSSGVVSARVPYGTSYTVSADKKSGYKTPEAQSFVASQATRNVAMEWLESDEGAYIAYTDGTKSRFDTLDEGKTPIGVALITENVSIVLHPSEGSSKTYSGDTSTVIEGVFTTTDRNQAMLDFAGAANTDAVIASGLAGTAFTFATEAVYADGRKGFLPSCGQMEEIRLNVSAINTALNLIGGTPLSFDKYIYWSSTQYSGYIAWLWSYYGSFWDFSAKYGSGYCRSVAAF